MHGENKTPAVSGGEAAAPPSPAPQPFQANFISMNSDRVRPNKQTQADEPEDAEKSKKICPAEERPEAAVSRGRQVGEIIEIS